MPKRTGLSSKRTGFSMQKTPIKAKNWEQKGDSETGNTNWQHRFRTIPCRAAKKKLHPAQRLDILVKAIHVKKAN
jgi:hypothetical protein